MHLFPCACFPQVLSSKTTAVIAEDPLTAWRPSSGNTRKEGDRGDQPEAWEKTVRQGDADFGTLKTDSTGQGCPVRESDNMGDSGSPSAVRRSPNKRAAGVDTVGCSWDLGNGNPDAESSRPSNDSTRSAHSVLPPCVVVPGGRSMPTDGQSQAIDSNDDGETCMNSCRFPDPIGDVMHGSTVEGGTSLSAELFRGTIPESTGDEAIERVGFRSGASGVTDASFATGAVKRRVSSPREPEVAPSARTNRDSRETVKPRTVSSEEILHTERSGGTERGVDPDADEGLVFDDAETCMIQPQLGDMKDACGSQDKRHSDSSSDADSSEDGQFNSSVSTSALSIHGYLL